MPLLRFDPHYKYDEHLPVGDEAPAWVRGGNMIALLGEQLIPGQTSVDHPAGPTYCGCGLRGVRSASFLMADPARDDPVAPRDDTPLQEDVRNDRDAISDRDRAGDAGSPTTHASDQGMLQQCTRASLESLRWIADARGWTEVSYDVRNELQLHVDEARRQ